MAPPSYDSKIIYKQEFVYPSGRTFIVEHHYNEEPSQREIEVDIEDIQHQYKSYHDMGSPNQSGKLMYSRIADEQARRAQLPVPLGKPWRVK